MIIAVFDNGRWQNYLTEETIEQFFKGYVKVESSFKAFLNDEYVHRAPNIYMYKRYYNPYTGKKIDWERLKQKFIKQAK